jgi:hypothetical protein
MYSGANSCTMGHYSDFMEHVLQSMHRYSGVHANTPNYLQAFEDTPVFLKYLHIVLSVFRVFSCTLEHLMYSGIHANTQKHTHALQHSCIAQVFVCTLEFSQVHVWTKCSGVCST